ncbi:MAG: biotin transporter BioY [Micrococcales bacterium]
MSLALVAKPTIIDSLIKRSNAADIALVVAGAALTAVAAQISIPAYPVPFTLQTLVVLLVGATLGSRRGVLSLGLYALAGLAGIPVFAPKADGSHVVGIDAFVGPTAGFIFGFVIAAFLVGLLAERKWSSNVLKTFVAFVVGSSIIYLIGVPVLASAAFKGDLNAAISYMVPFMVWDVVKAVIAAGLLPGAWLLVKKAK